jgi:hypothetical protein
MTIIIPRRDDKLARQVRDAFRILAWQYVMQEEKDAIIASGEKLNIDYGELYAEFYAEWCESEYMNMNLKELEKAAKDLGYSMAHLSQIRKEYYEERDRKKAMRSTTTTTVEYKESESESEEMAF